MPGRAARATGCAPGALGQRRKRLRLQGVESATVAPPICRSAAALGRFVRFRGHLLGADVSIVGQFRDIALALVVATSAGAPITAQAQDACRFVTIGTATVRAVTAD